MKILLTGAAGFIGFHTAKRLLTDGHEVIGLDNLCAYYDVQLKQNRLNQLKNFKNFEFCLLDIADRVAMPALFEQHQFDAVINLAAQAGVRYSITDPLAYIDANLVGFANILEGCRHNGVKHLVYASSSSVYGTNDVQPFAEHHNVDHPMSLYAATKKANELMAHSYAHLYDLPCTGLRFFTVYGPWGRPDMALFKFTRGILKGEEIEVYNHGEMLRDFTYIDDIVEGLVRVLQQPQPYRVFNIGNNNPVKLLDFIQAIEQALGKKARLKLLPLQPGDVIATSADVSNLEKAVGFRPQTTIEIGVKRFVDWYLGYYEEEQPEKLKMSLT